MRKEQKKGKEDGQFIQRIKILYNSAKCLEFIGEKMSWIWKEDQDT